MDNFERFRSMQDFYDQIGYGSEEDQLCKRVRRACHLYEIGVFTSKKEVVLAINSAMFHYSCVCEDLQKGLDAMCYLSNINMSILDKGETMPLKDMSDFIAILEKKLLK